MKHRVRVNRLLDAAKLPCEVAVETIPPHLAARLLAHWRSGVRADDWFLPLALRRGLLCAGIIMMICIVWSSSDFLSNDDNDFAIASFDVQEDVMP